MRRPRANALRRLPHISEKCGGSGPESRTSNQNRRKVPLQKQGKHSKALELQQKSLRNRSLR